MANLAFDKPVMHTGIIIPGTKTHIDEKTQHVTVTPGAVVDLDTDSRGLRAVAQSLVDRGMAHFTSDAATHTLAIIDASQQAMPLGSAGGTAPIADSVKQHLDNQHQVAAAKEAAASQQMAQVQGQTVAPQVQHPAAPAPVEPEKQPTPAEVAAAAATQN